VSSLWPSLLVFILVLAAIPAAAWLLRRAQAVRFGAGGPLQVASAVSVGTRERIALVRAHDKWLVVGITPNSITLLTELDEAPAGIDQLAGGPAGSKFSELLRNATGHASRPR
jgi:flagellar protein FliO/FliZ